jgi:thiamine-phosphate pyrophosphorylase
LRVKDAPDRQFLAWADAIAAHARAAGAQLIVNDRADIALMSGADGVHVGQEDLAPEAVRRAAAGRALMVGLSTHTLGQIAAAASQPADYVAIGPVFGTATKDTGYGAVGLEMVRAAAAGAGGKPVVAIGGVTIENARAAIDAGAASVAVISDLLSTGDPASRVRDYLGVLLKR